MYKSFDAAKDVSKQCSEKNTVQRCRSTHVYMDKQWKSSAAECENTFSVNSP